MGCVRSNRWAPEARTGSHKLRPPEGIAPAKKSDAHGHDDIAVAVGLVGQRPHLPGGLFVFQFDADRAIGRGAKKIQHVAGIKTDGDGIAFEFFLDGFFGFAVYRARSGDFDAFFRNGQLHGVGALIGELRDAAHRIAQFRPLDDHTLVVVPREHRLVVWELAGENARNQQAMADLEKEVAFVFCKFNVRVGARGAGKLDRKSTRLNSSHGYISYAVFCLKKKNTKRYSPSRRPRSRCWLRPCCACAPRSASQRPPVLHNRAAMSSPPCADYGPAAHSARPK